MKTYLAVGAATAGLALCPLAPVQAATQFTILLDSAQEIAPAGQSRSPATAFGNLQLLNTATGPALVFDLLFDDVHDFGPVLDDQFGQEIDPARVRPANDVTGTDVTALHIHNAARGAGGPVVFGLFNPSTDTDRDIRVEPGAAGGFRVTGAWDATEGNSVTLTDFLPGLLALQTGEDAPLYFNLHTASDPAGAIRGQVVAANDVAAVPLPGALWLLGVAIGGLFLQRRHRGRAA